MAKKNFYIDKNHPENGIYKSWNDCLLEKKKGGTNFIGFVTEIEAKEAMLKALSDSLAADSVSSAKPEKTVSDDNEGTGSDIVLPDTYAFVDGSYNISTKVYGYGGFLIHNGNKYILTGSDNDAEAASSRNVAGEVSGSMAAVQKAMDLGIEELTVYYDYEGIKCWADKTWKRNKKLTRDYEEFISNARAGGMKINFIHVKGHSGIPGNEEADSLAKGAVGL
ncbi:MAG: RNase H [Lachnospiraceae bacterium]|nr:RNase H [Lachnospiraceae bacterium]